MMGRQTVHLRVSVLTLGVSWVLWPWPMTKQTSLPLPVAIMTQQSLRDFEDATLPIDFQVMAGVGFSPWISRMSGQQGLLSGVDSVQPPLEPGSTIRPN